MTSEPNHLDKIRERFTVTADAFSQSVRTNRLEEAERLAERATEDLPSAKSLLAIDVACGPGTFTRPLAARVRHAIGVDLTPAMVEKARAEAVHDGVRNIEFVTGDVYALPFGEGVAGIVSCGYAVHHMTDPVRALAEMARVLEPGGRIVISDIIVPEGCDAALQDAAERMRDPSHTNTQSVVQFRTLMQNLGLHVRSEEFRENWHNFDQWMKSAGSSAGDTTYERTRELMTSYIDNDRSGFRVRTSENVTGGLKFMHTVLLIVAEKPAA